MSGCVFWVCTIYIPVIGAPCCITLLPVITRLYHRTYCPVFGWSGVSAQTLEKVRLLCVFLSLCAHAQLERRRRKINIQSRRNRHERLGWLKKYCLAYIDVVVLLHQLACDVNTRVAGRGLFVHFCVVLPVSVDHVGVSRRRRGVGDPGVCDDTNGLPCVVTKDLLKNSDISTNNPDPPCWKYHGTTCFDLLPLEFGAFYTFANIATGRFCFKPQ